MENAAKALIIAGAVLLAILVVSIGVYLRGNLQDTADTYIQTLDTAELRKYNSNFEVYANTEKIITAQDIVTLVEFAKKSEQGTKIFVKEKTGGYTDKTVGTFDVSDFLKKYILKEDDTKIYNSFKYKDNSIDYDTYGKVNEIKFEYVAEKIK